MRWIPAGKFLMGSPESESGRYDNEGPQHEVRISRGFWMMDTPVSQSLWQCVMGDGPSWFTDPDRPVEQVDWHQSNEFCKRLSAQFENSFRLPTEAEWEYACRAGTSAATYAGDLKILGDNNAPVLDEIAWYGGNSGYQFDLKDGYDSSDWKEKQYEHNKAGTRKVALKRPNHWGLYDTLGNVWEWCADGQREYTARPEFDPIGAAEEGTDRVLRGGHWSYYARDVRAACRYAHGPRDGTASIGFRCVWVQSSAEPRETESSDV